MTFHRHSSRRAELLMILILTAAPLLAGEVSPRLPTPVDEQFRRIGAAILTVRGESPDLIGFKEYAQIAENAFAKRSNEDGDLLAGRLYADAARQWALRPATAEPLGGKALTGRVRTLLSTHRPVDHYNRAFFDAMLKDTRQQMSVDAQFYRDILFARRLYEIFGWQSEWGDFPCYIDGERRDPSWCRSVLFTGAGELDRVP